MPKYPGDKTEHSRDFFASKNMPENAEPVFVIQQVWNYVFVIADFEPKNIFRQGGLGENRYLVSETKISKN